VLAHDFEVGVAHVVDAEDEDVLVGVDGFLHELEEGGVDLLRGLLLHLRGVHDLGALGFGHCGGLCVCFARSSELAIGYVLGVVSDLVLLVSLEFEMPDSRKENCLG
jgi:hypothetical protein